MGLCTRVCACACMCVCVCACANSRAHQQVNNGAFAAAVARVQNGGCHQVTRIGRLHLRKTLLIIIAVVYYTCIIIIIIVRDDDDNNINNSNNMFRRTRSAAAISIIVRAAAAAEANERTFFKRGIIFSFFRTSVERSAPCPRNVKNISYYHMSIKHNSCTLCRLHLF